MPKGSTIFISAYTIHNDPEVFDNASEFQPERWLTTDPVAAKKAKNGFFGFGDGPRVCPGSRFAQLEAKTVLVRTFQKYRLELQPGTVSTFSFLILLSPLDSSDSDLILWCWLFRLVRRAFPVFWGLAQTG